MCCGGKCGIGAGVYAVRVSGANGIVRIRAPDGSRDTVYGSGCPAGLVPLVALHSAFTNRQPPRSPVAPPPLPSA